MIWRGIPAASLITELPLIGDRFGRDTKKKARRDEKKAI
jgi:hypothetical protein